MKLDVFEGITDSWKVINEALSGFPAVLGHQWEEEVGLTNGGEPKWVNSDELHKGFTEWEKEHGKLYGLITPELLSSQDSYEDHLKDKYGLSQVEFPETRRGRLVIRVQRGTGLTDSEAGLLAGLLAIHARNMGQFSHVKVNGSCPLQLWTDYEVVHIYEFNYCYGS
jgi:hypothetical protein